MLFRSRIVIPAAATGLPDVVRKYNAAELFFERAWDDRWFMKGSWTIAHSYGNTEGYVKSDNGQGDAGITQDFDHPGLMEGSNGYLPNDRRHTIKLNGSYGLTDEWHPTQSLCDMFTMRESSGLEDRDISFAYVGDARFNQGRSLLIAGAMMGMDVRIVAPEALQPDPALVKTARRIGAATGARVTVTEDVGAVKGVDFVHTDIWVSMGEPKEVWTERIELLTPYRVTTELLERTENPDVKFMHCLPSYHDLDTTVSQQILAETGKEVFEVTEEVFESPASLVFEQAENRLHTIKAILVATLAG